MRSKHLTTAAMTLAGLALATAAHAGKTLDAVKARGQVVCGVNTSGPGFSSADSQGKWSGLDVDFCRAVAAAVLKDADKVKYVPLNSQQRFASLQAGEIDVLSRNSTWTLSRDASLGVVFTGINYYDGQGFMVPKKLKIDNVNKLNGATVCVQAGTTSEKNVADYFGAHNMKYKSVVFDTAEAITSAFFAGRCQVYTTDMSDLAGLQRGEALLRIERHVLDLLGVLEHGRGDGATEVDVETRPFALAVSRRKTRPRGIDAADDLAACLYRVERLAGMGGGCEADAGQRQRRRGQVLE